LWVFCFQKRRKFTIESDLKTKKLRAERPGMGFNACSGFPLWDHRR